MAQRRVYELARELGCDTRVVLEELTAMGEFVRSASSTVPGPVVARLRQRLHTKIGPRPGRSVQNAPVERPSEIASPTAHLGPPPAPRPAPVGPIGRRREWYRGEPAEGFVKVLLDGYVVSTDAGHRPYKALYWLDEVERARKLASAWAGCLLSMTNEDILAWMATRVGPENALELHRRGVTPEEVGWSYADRGRDPLDHRLRIGEFTVEQVVIEVEGRRHQAEAETGV